GPPRRRRTLGRLDHHPRPRGGLTVPTPTHQAVRKALTDVGAFSRLLPRPMRDYQRTAAAGIADALTTRRGDLLAMVFSRQAGKDETLAQLLAWLLLRHSKTGGGIVVAAPTQQ